MLDGLLRPVKERYLAPFAAAIGRRVSPMVVTLLAFAVGLGAAACTLLGLYGAALILWLVNRLLDGLDGTMARVQGTASDLGGYVDILLDFVVYACIPMGFALGIGDRPTLVAALALLASFYVNAASWMYLAAVLERRDRGAASRGELTSVTMPPGLIGGTETVVFYTAFFLLPGFVGVLFWIMSGLVMVSVLQRLWWAVRQL